MLNLTKKGSTTTRHVSRLQILAQHQFWKRPPPRAKQQYQHLRNLTNTVIVYFNTNTMYANTRIGKLSTINTKQDVWCYIAWLQATLRNPLYQHITTASMGFFFSILFPVWTTSESTMELSSQNNYKILIFHWIQTVTWLLPLEHYSLALETVNYSPKLENIHSLRKYHFLCIPCHQIHWIVQPTMWYLFRKSHMCQKME